MGIIQRTTLFGYFDDAKEIQICIQDQSMMTILKIIWEEALFILGGIGITADPGQNSYDPRLMVQIGKFFLDNTNNFGQNVGFWPPGVSIYGITPHCYAINFE